MAASDKKHKLLFAVGLLLFLTGFGILSFFGVRKICRPANKSQYLRMQFHETFIYGKMGMTIRPPKRPKKMKCSCSRPATLTEHHKNAVSVVPTVRNS